MATSCPVCTSGNTTSLYPDYVGKCITSDMMVVGSAAIDNRLCQDCGLVFNAAGTRGATKDFYNRLYSLMLQNPDATIQSFTGDKPISQAERSCQLLLDLAELPSSGRIVEVGAGKGDFLGWFLKKHSSWEVHALEPSRAYEYLAERFPGVELERCDYGDSQCATDSYDVVVALGVLEHVENPLDMLEWANRLLKRGGLFFIRVPNFANNPNDLFCVDHLSKLTLPTLSNLAQAAGFRVLTTRDGGVAVFLLIEKTGERKPLGDVSAENREIAQKNIEVASKGVSAVVAARDAARSANENFGIFGLGPSGLFAPYYAGFDPVEITAYIDENKTMWGSKVHDRPVGGFDLMKDLAIRHIALAISPVYFEKVTAKLNAYGVKVYSA